MFAIDPEYMKIPGEDEIGFRCLAQRSRLADWVKDNGAVSMFPNLADEWWNQVQAQTPWKNFRAEDFSRLKKTYGVDWVVVQQPGITGLDCPYRKFRGAGLPNSLKPRAKIHPTPAWRFRFLRA